MKRLIPIITLVIAAATVAAFRISPRTAHGASTAPPKATVTTIVSLPGVSTREVAVGGHGNFVYMTTDSNEVLVYDRATKKTSVVIHGSFSGVNGAPSGDHIGLVHLAEGANPRTSGSHLLWTLAVDPATGLATGEPRRLSMTPSYQMRISPDGKQVAFLSDTKTTQLIVVPINGGAERVVAEGDFDVPIRWSPVGKWIYVAKTTLIHNYVVRVPASGGTPTEVTPSVKSPSP